MVNVLPAAPLTILLPWLMNDMRLHFSSHTSMRFPYSLTSEIIFSVHILMPTLFSSRLACYCLLLEILSEYFFSLVENLFRLGCKLKSKSLAY